MKAANLMSAQKAHHEPSQRIHLSNRGLMFAYASGLVLLLTLLAVVARMQRNDLVIPDEKAVAANLLAQHLTGPRYFQVPPGDMRDAAGVTVKTATEPHITTEAARSQVDRIVKERNLSADQAAKVQALIGRLTEQPASRLVGAEHVKLLRLNLALDSL